VDTVFSTYRPDSDISKLRRGSLSLADASPHVGEVLELCVLMQRETGGYFSAMFDGALDPTGLVKGWAIERASELLAAHGSANHAVNGGGDMQLAGESAPGQPWRVGITDPLDRTRVLTTISGRDFAVATSGSAERGAHIVNPFTGLPAEALAGVTVTGRRLTQVDVLATAAFAMGARASAWLDEVDGYEGLVVTKDGGVHVTRRFQVGHRGTSPG
jgi:thiamine biosynthesis lipoprotein